MWKVWICQHKMGNVKEYIFKNIYLCLMPLTLYFILHNMLVTSLAILFLILWLLATMYFLFLINKENNHFNISSSALITFQLLGVLFSESSYNIFPHENNCANHSYCHTSYWYRQIYSCGACISFVFLS